MSGDLHQFAVSVPSQLRSSVGSKHPHRFSLANKPFKNFYGSRALGRSFPFGINVRSKWWQVVADGRTSNYPLDRACDQLGQSAHTFHVKEEGDSHGQLGFKVSGAAIRSDSTTRRLRSLAP